MQDILIWKGKLWVKTRLETRQGIMNENKMEDKIMLNNKKVKIIPNILR